MAHPLDHLILIGFPSFDEESPSGQNAISHILDVSNVRKEGVHFFDSTVAMQDVVKGSFPRDSSQQYGYRIGASLCISSDSIGTENNLKVNKLSKLGIEVRTGYEDIDFLSVSESKLKSWFESGILSESLEERDDDENFIDYLMGKFGDEENEAKDDEDTPHRETVSEGEENSTLNADEHISDESITNIDLLEEPAHSSRVRSESRALHNDTELAFDKDEKNEEGSSSFFRLGESNDEMEYVKKIQADRNRAKKKKEMEESSEKETPWQEESLVDEVFSDPITESGNRMARSVSDESEQMYRKDGSFKNYKEHLPPKESRMQQTAENVAEFFGSSLDDSDSELKDLQYVERDRGRIVMCTSGKGGVGKSLVSSGLASALSLGKAKQRAENPAATSSRTWLIESDYNSPQLAVAYKTGDKHLGNVAEIMSRTDGKISNKEVRKAIEDNIVVDEETGVIVLACPPLSKRKSSKEIPISILRAINYASKAGDDVIIDHGNLTSGEYSELDDVLSKNVAHRVVIVGNMSCISQTQATLSILCEREPGSMSKVRPWQSVAVVLNSARKEQFYIAQDRLKPFNIINVIPPIDALKPENILSDEIHLVNAPQDVKRAVIDRCGVMLTKLGYYSMQPFFSVKAMDKPRKQKKRNFFKDVAALIARS